jgi:uncharacterized protein YqeY
MTISSTITHKIGEAMKARDEVRLSTLRILSSEFNYEKIKLQHELTDEEELAVIRREAKKRKESVEAYSKAGATDRAERETAELSILQEYLPPELTEEEINQLVSNSISETGATSVADMGKVIGMVKSKNPNVDGGKLAMLVKQRLT